MLQDSVFAIREAVVDSMVKISESPLDKAWLEEVFRAKVTEFSRHERFMIRIQTIHFVSTLKDCASKDMINKCFAEALLRLAEDPVPNIRFNVSKNLEVLYPKLTPGNKIKAESALKKMTSDKDFDASFFAQQALATISRL